MRHFASVSLASLVLAALGSLTLLAPTGCGGIAFGVPDAGDGGGGGGGGGGTCGPPYTCPPPPACPPGEVCPGIECAVPALGTCISTEPVEGACCLPGQSICQPPGTSACCVGYVWTCSQIGGGIYPGSGSPGYAWHKAELGCACEVDGGTDAPPDVISTEAGDAGDAGDVVTTDAPVDAPFDVIWDEAGDGSAPDCGGTICGPGDICVVTTVSGGACIPPEAGVCPPGTTGPGSGCCSYVSTSYACKSMPSTCGAGLNCGCDTRDCASYGTTCSTSGRTLTCTIEGA